MLHEIGREPTPEELAEKLSMPIDKVRKVLKIAKSRSASKRPLATRKTAISVILSKIKMRFSR